MQSREYYRGKAILAFGTTIIKYSPVIVAMISMLYCGILEMDLRFPFMDTLLSTSFYGLIVYTSASYAFGFCRLHRLFIAYNFAISFCCDFQSKEGYTFGSLLQPLHWITFGIGILLFVHLAYKALYLKENCFQNRITNKTSNEMEN